MKLGVARHLPYLLYRLLRHTPPFRKLASQIPAYAYEEYLIRQFLESDHGAAYGVTRAERVQLLRQFQQIVRVIPSGTPALYHMLFAQDILNMPPDLPGAVVECGVWKGACSTSLSLVCERVGRRLYVCDSFAGLPGTVPHRYELGHAQAYDELGPGLLWGTLAEVQHNIAQYGSLAPCEFIVGWFEESLRHINEPIVLAFLDADLESSTRACLRHLWRLLAEDGLMYCDDAANMDVVRVFFDDGWWQAHVGCRSPGFVGLGCGLPLNPGLSTLGYTCKWGSSATMRRVYNYEFVLT
ncbi:MAG: hypothetical protein HC911_12425 [Chloroflexaceae bacterium]|nr:hypothetical protein [Chloroflexaceae bacterium]